MTRSKLTLFNLKRSIKQKSGRPGNLIISSGNLVCHCIMSTDFTPPFWAYSATTCVSPGVYPWGKNAVHFGVFT